MASIGEKFKPGRLTCSPSVNYLMWLNPIFRMATHEALFLHVAGSWGHVNEDEKWINEWALQEGEKLVSTYKIEGFPMLVVITEPDRTETAVLLSHEC